MSDTSTNHNDVCTKSDIIIPLINTTSVVSIPIEPVINQGKPRFILSQPDNLTQPYLASFKIKSNNFGLGIGNYLDNYKGVTLDKTFLFRNHKFLKELSPREKFILSGYTYQGDRLANLYLRKDSLVDYIMNWTPDLNVKGRFLNPLYFQLSDRLKSLRSKVIQTEAFKINGDELIQWLESNLKVRDDKFVSLIQDCVKQYTEELLSILNKAPELKEETVVFRGTKTYYYKKNKDDIFTNIDIMSTTINPNIALKFSGKEETECCFNQIHLSPGTKVIFMEPITQGEEEFEIIIPPNNNFKIISNTNKPYSYNKTKSSTYKEQSCLQSKYSMRYTILKTV